MKLNKLFLGAIAALASAAMVACSDDAPDVNNGGENPDGESSYLAVNIVAPTSGASRAQYPNQQPDNATYEDGTETENAVKAIRFYFFTDGGVATIVKKGSTANYYDWTYSKDDPDITVTPGTAPNIESIISAILIIDTSAGDRLPGQVVAVINPDTKQLGSTSMNLETLRNVSDDYAELANGTTPQFVMANSVYMNNDKEVVKATKLKITDFKDTKDAAKAAPVDIYVERNVAKVRTKFAESLNVTNGNTIRAQEKDADGNPKPVTITWRDAEGTENSTDVYIKVEGWNVTGTLPAADLSKHIDPSWTNTVISDAGASWNYPDYHRSFWAQKNSNPGANQWIGQDKYKSLSIGGATYINENADKGKSNIQATEVVMQASFIDQNNDPIQICEFAGVRTIAKNSDYTLLKRALLQFLRNNKQNVWYYDETESKYKEIAPEDIEFKTKKELEPDATSGLYVVYAQLTKTAEEKTWLAAAEEGASEVATTDINANLKKLGSSMIYNQSYFFTPIKHFDRDGVVRNHIYDLKITGVTGLGTPIYKPEEVPLETPQTRESFLAARINILTWRVMSQNVNFGE